MRVTESGTVKLTKELQFLKAAFSIPIKESGMVKFTNELQFQKA